jgi:hypothetical protein
MAERQSAHRHPAGQYPTSFSCLCLAPSFPSFTLTIIHNPFTFNPSPSISLYFCLFPSHLHTLAYYVISRAHCPFLASIHLLLELIFSPSPTHSDLDFLPYAHQGDL